MSPDTQGALITAMVATGCPSVKGKKDGGAASSAEAASAEVKVEVCLV